MWGQGRVPGARPGKSGAARSWGRKPSQGVGRVDTQPGLPTDVPVTDPPPLLPPPQALPPSLLAWPLWLRATFSGGDSPHC